MVDLIARIASYGREELDERFWSKVDRGGPDSCWEWTASRTATGYGQFSLRDKPFKAHRIAWVLSVGATAEPECVMHSCDNRLCVNPAHLSNGSVRLNNIDREVKGRNRIEPAHEKAWANRKARTHCKHGHEFTLENTRLYWPKNRPGVTRICLACRRAASKS